MSGLTGPVRTGIVGAGVISDQYLRNLAMFPDVRVEYVADLDQARAASQALKYGVPGSGALEELLARHDIELIVNLTNPSAHGAVTTAALQAGKHVWGEKPLATTRAEGLELLQEARHRGLRLAAAPDTFLGEGLQSAISALRAGAIGTPQYAVASMQGPGPESWHPHPEFLYAAGAGPLFDMGPYYLTALVQALGPVRRVSARACTPRSVRTVKTGPRAGLRFDVAVSTHVTGLVEFCDGSFAHLTFSFDSPQQRRAALEITGTHGTMALPDPNTFGGSHSAWVHDNDEPVSSIAETTPPHGRGIGVVDFARSIRAGVPARTSGELAFHVLDTLIALDEAASQSSWVDVTSCVTPAPLLDRGWDPVGATL